MTSTLKTGKQYAVTLIYGETLIETTARGGDLLGDTISKAGLPLEQPCAGRGTCGRCKILVEVGAAQPDEIERRYLTPGELAVGTRLACRALVSGDTQVMLSPIEVISNKIFKKSRRYKQDKIVPLGLAVDLGSTTVAAYLTMMDNGEVVLGGAALNQQSIYGADVISRLAAAGKSTEHADRLQKLAISSIIQAIDALKLSPHDLERVQRMTIVGNVAMHHLLLGLPVHTISTMPFQPYQKKPIQGDEELFKGILPGHTQVWLPPMIGGFVGSDALACLAYFGFNQPSGPKLVIDLGTNGEVLLTDGEQIVAASTAAGPAFEGVNIACGMRASEGAIVKFNLQQDDLSFETIGDLPPTGITGSGLLSIVRILLDLGVIEPHGRLTSSSSGLGSKVQVNGQRMKFIPLTTNHAVYLTQADIRELQKAKGAILAAIKVLLAELDLKPSDLEAVILTGSFGSQVDVGTVIALGMLLDVPPDIIHSIPNGAGMGAAMFLSEEGFLWGEELAQKTRQIDLDQNANFHEIFINSLSFDKSS
jgi:uncharacterized 2Fe-2S/4Fe-4S cluster protein (DUF4445 family)